MGSNKRLSKEGRGFVIIVGVFSYIALLALIISLQSCGDEGIPFNWANFFGCPIFVTPAHDGNGDNSGNPPNPANPEDPTPTPTPGGEDPTNPSGPTDPVPTPTPEATPTPSDEGNDPGNPHGQEACEDQEKVWVCHYPAGDVEKAFNICVNDKAAEAHLKNGDTLGDCPSN